MDRFINRLLVLLSAVVVAGAAAAPADACINEYYLEVDRKTRDVERSERLLQAGRAAPAFRTAARARARARTRSAMRGRHDSAALDARIEQVMAVATARLDGGVDVDRGRVVRRASAAQRQESLAWALEVMNRALGSGDDPLLRARRAEVLARISGREAYARDELEALAERDLMPDAHAWATLARLRGSAGDAAGRTEAIDRCKTMAGRRARAICGDGPRRDARRMRDRS